MIEERETEEAAEELARYESVAAFRIARADAKSPYKALGAARTLLGGIPEVLAEADRARRGMTCEVLDAAGDPVDLDAPPGEISEAVSAPSVHSWEVTVRVTLAASDREEAAEILEMIGGSIAEGFWRDEGELILFDPSCDWSDPAELPA